MPPLAGVAVKLTKLPGQIEVAGVVTITDGVTVGETVIAIGGDIAVFGNIQMALEVMLTETISPFDKVLVEKLGEFIPALIPLIFH